MEDQFSDFEDWTPSQRDSILDELICQQQIKKPVRLKLTGKKEAHVIGPHHDEPELLYALKLQRAFGTTSMDYVVDKLNELVNYFDKANNRGCSEGELNAAIAFIASAKPRNEVEATLATQMVITNDAAMRSIRMIPASNWIDQTAAFGNIGTKLLRAYTAQVDALAKLQRGGTQTIKHVHIDNRNGQAVIAGQVNSGGGGG